MDSILMNLILHKIQTLVICIPLNNRIAFFVFKPASTCSWSNFSTQKIQRNKDEKKKWSLRYYLHHQAKFRLEWNFERALKIHLQRVVFFRSAMFCRFLSFSLVSENLDLCSQKKKKELRKLMYFILRIARKEPRTGKKVLTCFMWGQWALLLLWSSAWKLDC